MKLYKINDNITKNLNINRYFFTKNTKQKHFLQSFTTGKTQTFGPRQQNTHTKAFQNKVLLGESRAVDMQEVISAPQIKDSICITMCTFDAATRSVRLLCLLYVRLSLFQFGTNVVPHLEHRGTIHFCCKFYKKNHCI